MKLNTKTIENFIKDYENGLNASNIGKKYGVHYTTVLRHLKKNNIKIRLDCSRKYKINEDFFNVIDTQEKAYFLGLLYSDGCNTTECNLIRIVLTNSDRKILEKLSSIIYIDYRPLEIRPEKTGIFRGKEYTTKESCVLAISSKKISKQLEALGVVKAKTNKITFPSYLSDELISHFIRGYFDGDGSISFTKKNKYQ